MSLPGSTTNKQYDVFVVAWSTEDLEAYTTPFIFLVICYLMLHVVLKHEDL